MRIDGMGIGAGGVSSVTARGVVYHLNQVDDLNRQYTALGAGVEVGAVRTDCGCAPQTGSPTSNVVLAS